MILKILKTSASDKLIINELLQNRMLGLEILFDKIIDLGLKIASDMRL